MTKFLEIIEGFLERIFSRTVVDHTKPLSQNNTRHSNDTKTPSTLIPVQSEKTEQTFSGDPCFLVCPIQNDENGKPLTSRTAKITAVIDHLGTNIDSNSTNSWGLNAKDQKVKAFNGELGNGESGAEKPYGYTKKPPAPFFSAKEINYVGAASTGDTYGPTYYLNYDGHAGYDFKCSEGTEIVAPADGDLYKAQMDPVNGSNKTWYKKNFGKDNPTAWEGWHSFFIKHPNGFSSWFLHCTKLVDDIEKQLLDSYQKYVPVKQGNVVAFSGKYGGVPPHLHFEVRNNKNSIVDPYQDQLWED